MNDTPWLAEGRLPTPEEKQLIIRRAHAERAQAIREGFLALAALIAAAWRKPDAAQTARVAHGLKTVPCA